MSVATLPRLGFLGVGWIGRNRMEAVAPYVEVAAIHDPAPLDFVTQCYKPSFDELLDCDLDGVVIATPSALHAEQAIAALERGLAVFCQKPLGRTATEARRVVDAARAADRLLAVDLSYRFTRAAQALGALDLATRLVRVRGRLVIAGYHQDAERRVDMQTWNWRGLDVVNAHEREPRAYVDGIREAARLTVAGVLDVEALVTHRFPLDRATEAFDAASQRGPGFVKAWVAP